MRQILSKRVFKAFPRIVCEQFARLNYRIVLVLPDLFEAYSNYLMFYHFYYKNTYFRFNV